MKEPQVSVIVPIYNVSRYLKECLDSLERQTLKSIEVIMVNDGSTDSSADIAQEYADKNVNFKLVNRVNGGLSAARNTGLEHASGEYVYFLDSDDFIVDAAMEILYHKAKEKDLDVLKFAAYSFIDGTKDYRWERNSSGGYKYNGNYPDVYDGDIFCQMTIGNNDIFSSCCLIFTKRNVIMKSKLRFCEGILFEDNLFNFELTILSKRVAVLNEPLYYRRLRTGSITQNSSWLKGIKAMCVSAEETDDFIKKHPEISRESGNYQMRFFISMMLKHIGCFTKGDLYSAEAQDYYRRIRLLVDKYIDVSDRGIRFWFNKYLRYTLYVRIRHLGYKVLDKYNSLKLII